MGCGAVVGEEIDAGSEVEDVVMSAVLEAETVLELEVGVGVGVVVEDVSRPDVATLLLGS